MMDKNSKDWNALLTRITTERYRSDLSVAFLNNRYLTNPEFFKDYKGFPKKTYQGHSTPNDAQF